MNKQIEEIANDLNMHCCSLAEQFCGEMSCNYCITQWLYHAGYRRQNEVASEIISEIEQVIMAHGTNYALKRLEEIKKKFGVKKCQTN